MTKKSFGENTHLIPLNMTQVHNYLKAKYAKLSKKNNNGT